MRKALLLDFDNTLVGTEQGNMTVFRKLMDDYFGHYFLPGDRENITCQSWRSIFHYLAEKYGNGKVDGEEMRMDFVERKVVYFKDHKPRTATGLDAVLALPVKKALVTGSSRVDLELFTDIIDYGSFDAIVTDDDINHGKPSPEPYQKALSLIDIAPEDAMAVEDSRMGITSARAAGVFTVFSREFADEDHSSLADMTVDDLTYLFK